MTNVKVEDGILSVTAKDESGLYPHLYRLNSEYLKYSKGR